jgi:ribose 5-phosphate isomerase B
MAKLHNNANLIVFGARVVGAGVAIDALTAYREAEFEGGRHQRRVDKLMAIEE